MTGFALGGNKARKAEFLLAEALQKDCDVILTAGAIQSNHARVIAAAARRYSRECHLFLGGQKPDEPTANLLLDKLAKAQVHVVASEAESSFMERFAEELRGLGRRPYVIPIGGSNEIGAQGYALGFRELEHQLRALPPKSTTLLFASSSGGTHAGLFVGKTIDKSEVKLLGVRVDKDPGLQEVICTIADKLLMRLRSDEKLQPNDVVLDSDYVGEDYGVPSEQGIGALKKLWQSEGILLDPVYTAKAMACLIDLAREGEWAQDERVAFLHSGGTPSIFNFPTQFSIS